MANGRVATGFSYPYVAIYSASGTTVTYSDAMPLARGVSVDVTIDEPSDNDFYADNQTAETISGTFTSGSISLTVDGLKDAAKKLILGLPTADTDGWTHYGDSQAVPYVGLGYITRYMEDGVTTYVPTLYPKVMFNNPGQSAATQEAEIDWQTANLTANLFRDDSANRDWFREKTAESTEAAALAALQTALS